MNTRSCYITSSAIGLGSGMIVTAILAQVDQWEPVNAFFAGLGTAGVLGGLCLATLLMTIAFGNWFKTPFPLDKRY